MWLNRALVTLGIVLTLAGTARGQAVDTSFKSGADAGVYALAVQADGKILVGGNFQVLGPLPGPGGTSRSFLGRLNTDGSVDLSFNPGANGPVSALAVQADGKILVGGNFTALATTTRHGIGRLNVDGSLDTSFNPSIAGPAPAVVNTFAVQGNGQILVGGAFTALNGISRSNIGRLNTDGSLDLSFNSPSIVAGQTNVSALALQANGQIVVGGNFEIASSAACTDLVQLNADGSVNLCEYTRLGGSFTAGGVNALAVQANGQILVGGNFTALGPASGSASRSNLARLNANGSVDTSFNPGADNLVITIAVQADGKILVAGTFTMLGGGGTGTMPREKLGRLNADGSLDPSFNPGVDSAQSPQVNAFAVQPDGKVVVGGLFTEWGGGTGTTECFGLGRLLNTTPPVDFNEDGSGDAFLQNAAGNWAVEDSGSGGGFTTTGSGTWTPGWSVTPAHFSGSGLTDLFLFNNTTGQWFRMLNNGSGGFTVQSTAAWGTNWQRFVVDLNGDGISDVFLWDPTTGQWFECLSNASGNFTYTQGFWSPGWEVYPMHFTSDGRQDFFLFNRSTGQWFWAEGAPGGGFTYPQSAFWGPGWTFYPGDFNGDGLTDLLLFNPSTGQWFTAMTGASGFSYTPGFFATGFNIYPMDLQGLGRTDLFLHNPTTGQWFEMISNGAGGFTNVGGAAWSTGWQLYPTNFTGDGAQDLLLYNPTTGVWFQAINQYPDGSPAVFSYIGGVWSPGLTIVARRPYLGGG